jgi:ketosteroid isomerase-like protein
MKHVFSFYLITVFVLTACNSANTESNTGIEKETKDLSTETMKKIVSERNLVYNNAMVNGDSLNLVNHFTSDCVVLPPNGEQIVGKAAIIPAVMSFSKMGIKKFTDETTRVLGGSNYIIEEGNYFFGGENNSTLDKGKYLCVWKKEGGEWRVCSNMWNTSLPAEKK